MEQIIALNNIYGSLYIMSALYFIGASFLLWVTDADYQRSNGTRIPLANKIIASLFGLMLLGYL